MTFVSALFSRTHLNANYFAVLNESFKVISLFSYQSSLSCCRSVTFTSYQIFKRLSTTFLTFFKVICFCCVTHATACTCYHRFLLLSTTFFIFLKLLFISLCFPRQLLDNTIGALHCQHFSAHFLHFFQVFI